MCLYQIICPMLKKGKNIISKFDKILLLVQKLLQHKMDSLGCVVFSSPRAKTAPECVSLAKLLSLL